MTKRQFLAGVVLPLSLFLLALAIRIPYLHEMPAFNGNELSVTMQLVKGEAFPLHNKRPHIGALSNYIYAIGFWVFGMHFWVPGMITVIAGALTIPVVFYLGKRLLNIESAILAAWMMCGCVYHVYFISHVPWSNSWTPFFSLISFLLFVIALQTQKSLWLIASAFAFGLAFQTHSSVATIAPALVVLFAMQGKERLREWFRKRSFYLILPAAILGCLNLAYYNIQSRLEGVLFQFKYPKYALEANQQNTSYFSNLESAWHLLFRLTSGSAEEKTAAGFWTDPVYLLCAVFLIGGMILCFKSRKLELPLYLLFPIFTIPIINHGYDFCDLGRYLGFLIAPACLLVSYFVVHASYAFKKRWPGARFVPLVLISGFAVLYMASQMRELYKVYAVFKTENNSEDFLKIREGLSRFDRHSTSILVDPFAYKAAGLVGFLESDGWRVEEMRMPGGATHLKKDKDFSRFPLKNLNSQIEASYEKVPDATTICLVSPFLLKPFLQQVPVVSIDAALAKGMQVESRNWTQLMLMYSYYMVRVSPYESSQKSKWLRQISKRIPPDLAQASTRKQKKGPLKRTPPMVRLEHELNSVAIRVPEYAQAPYLICKGARRAPAN